MFLESIKTEPSPVQAAAAAAACEAGFNIGYHQHIGNSIKSSEPFYSPKIESSYFHWRRLNCMFVNLNPCYFSSEPLCTKASLSRQNKVYSQFMSDGKNTGKSRKALAAEKQTWLVWTEGKTCAETLQESSLNVTGPKTYFACQLAKQQLNRSIRPQFSLKKLCLMRWQPKVYLTGLLRKSHTFLALLIHLFMVLKPLMPAAKYVQKMGSLSMQSGTVCFN